MRRPHMPSAAFDFSQIPANGIENSNVCRERNIRPTSRGRRGAVSTAHSLIRIAITATAFILIYGLAGWIFPDPSLSP